jgi:hypothetical protein
MYLVFMIILITRYELMVIKGKQENNFWILSNEWTKNMMTAYQTDTFGIG